MSPHLDIESNFFRTKGNLILLYSLALSMRDCERLVRLRLKVSGRSVWLQGREVSTPYFKLNLKKRHLGGWGGERKKEKKENKEREKENKEREKENKERKRKREREREERGERMKERKKERKKER